MEKMGNKRKKKRVISVLLLFFLMLLAHPVGAEEPAIRITVNGQPVAVDVPPQLVAGRTLVPLRTVFDALGGYVFWEEQRSMVIGYLAGKQVECVIGQSVAYIDAQQTEPLDSPPQLIEGRTMVPIRFLAELAGCSVAWQAEERLVEIQTNGDGRQAEEQTLSGVDLRGASVYCYGLLNAGYHPAGTAGLKKAFVRGDGAVSVQLIGTMLHVMPDVSDEQK